MTTYDFNLITAFANSAPSNEIAPFPDYNRGLGIAFDETDGKPEMKGLNGLFSLMTVSLLALKQRGILAWTTGFEYKQGAFAVESNKLYQAKADNTSKQPSLSQNEWQVWASVSDIDVDTNDNIIKTVKAGGAFTLKVEDASTAVKGVVRAATTTEVANKLNVNAYVTPSNTSTIAQSTDIGVGQSWVDVSSSRSNNTEYTNTTNSPIFVSIYSNAPQQYGKNISLFVDDIRVGYMDTASNDDAQLTTIVPRGSSYKVSFSGFTLNTNLWWTELR